MYIWNNSMMIVRHQQTAASTPTSNSTATTTTCWLHQTSRRPLFRVKIEIYGMWRKHRDLGRCRWWWCWWWCRCLWRWCLSFVGRRCHQRCRGRGRCGHERINVRADWETRRMRRGRFASEGSRWCFFVYYFL